MMIVTTENIANHQIPEVVGTVFGLNVRARGIGKYIVASVKGLVGGEINQYTEMLEDARKQAMDRMVQNATAMGANAIIMMRFDSGEAAPRPVEIAGSKTELLLADNHLKEYPSSKK